MNLRTEYAVHQTNDVRTRAKRSRCCSCSCCCQHAGYHPRRRRTYDVWPDVRRRPGASAADDTQFTLPALQPRARCAARRRRRHEIDVKTAPELSVALAADNIHTSNDRTGGPRNPARAEHGLTRIKEGSDCNATRPR